MSTWESIRTPRIQIRATQEIDVTSDALTKTRGSEIEPSDQARRLKKSLGRLNRLARLMDDQFEIPIIKYRVGLDPIIGIIPGGGDWVTWVVSVYVIWEGVRLGAPVRVLVKMGANATVDLVMGYVPGIGDIADALYKANRKNVDLLLIHFEAESRDNDSIVVLENSEIEPTRRGRIARYAVGITIIAVLFVLASIPIAVMAWLITQVGS